MKNSDLLIGILEQIETCNDSECARLLDAFLKIKNKDDRSKVLEYAENINQKYLN